MFLKDFHHLIISLKFGSSTCTYKIKCTRIKKLKKLNSFTYSANKMSDYEVIQTEGFVSQFGFRGTSSGGDGRMVTRVMSLPKRTYNNRGKLVYVHEHSGKTGLSYTCVLVHKN